MEGYPITQEQVNAQIAIDKLDEQVRVKFFTALAGLAVSVMQTPDVKWLSFETGKT